MLDTATWAPVTAVPTDDFMQDMAYDYSTSTMYGIRTSGNGSELVTIDLGNGTATPIGPTGANLHALACSTDGRLYALTDGGELCTVDKSTAATATVGSTGIADVAYLQSMAFDHNTGRLFWAHTGEMSQGELYEVDPASATVVPLLPNWYACTRPTSMCPTASATTALKQESSACAARATAS